MPNTAKVSMSLFKGLLANLRTCDCGWILVSLKSLYLRAAKLLPKSIDTGIFLFLKEIYSLTGFDSETIPSIGILSHTDGVTVKIIKYCLSISNFGT